MYFINKEPVKCFDFILYNYNSMSHLVEQWFLMQLEQKCSSFRLPMRVCFMWLIIRKVPS